MTPAGHGRRRRLPRKLRIAAAAALAAGALWSLTADTTTSGQVRGEPPGDADEEPPSPFAPAEPEEATDPAEAEQLELGRRLFVDGCSSCHGFDARGIEGRGPSLRGVGEAAADFYLRTGRMPLDDPGDQPLRSQSPYTRGEQEAITAYVGRFGGPGIPEVDPDRGDVAEGLALFGEHCAGCHQLIARGGITTQSVVPDLQVSEPVDVAEAIEIGPYVMPRLAEQLSRSDVDSLARYIAYTRDPDDAGGWGIGHVGPIPEGMVAWLLAGAALLFVIRLIGERTTE